MLNKHKNNNFVSKLNSKLHNNYSVSADFGINTIKLNILNLLTNEVIEHSLTESEMSLLDTSVNDFIFKLISDLNLKRNSSVDHKKWLVNERKQDKLTKSNNKTKRTSVLT